jgi:hypothetical protein
LDVNNQIGLGKLVAQALDLGLQLKNQAILCRFRLNLRTTLTFDQLGLAGELTLLAPGGQVRRIDAFTAQQRTDVAGATHASAAARMRAASRLWKSCAVWPLAPPQGQDGRLCYLKFAAFGCA